MIIVIGGIKGGSGKTTLATNLTVVRSAMFKKVLLVDADEQKSSSTWKLQREQEGHEAPWVTIQLTNSNIGSEIKKMKNDYDDIIIDVGGRDTRAQRSVLLVADAFVSPFLPRSLDIWTAGLVNSMISDALVINPNLKSYIVINRADPNGQDNESACEILKECEHLECMPHMLGQRKAFSNAASLGLGVIEMKNPDKKASDEIFQVSEYIYKNHTKNIHI